MPKSTKSENLSTYISSDLVAKITERGEAIDKKKGTYAAMILEWWEAQGCPPVSEIDRVMQLAKQASKPAKKSA